MLAPGSVATGCEACLWCKAPPTKGRPDVVAAGLIYFGGWPGGPSETASVPGMSENTSGAGVAEPRDRTVDEEQPPGRGPTGDASFLEGIEVRRILLPIDATDASLQPLGLAAELSRALRADLHFLWVDSADQEGRPTPEYPSQEEVDEAMWLAEPERLREAAQSSGFVPRITRSIAFGPSAPTVIAQYCEENRIDLVIMATRRRGFVSRLFDRSAATEVVRHAPCSVLVVPDASLEKVIAIPPQILAAVDFSEESAAALAVAEVLRRGLDGDLFLLHVENAPHADEAASLSVLSAQETDRAHSTLARAAEEIGAEAELLVRRGAPAAAILRVVDDCDADLLVVGSHGRKGLPRLVLGSVAEHLIGKSPVPVLVVRRKG